MESPYPPQLSLPSSANASSSQDAGTSGSSVGAPASHSNGTTATTSASEPRQTLRKRTRTTEDASAGFECGPDEIEASGSVLADDDSRLRGLSKERRIVRGGAARRLTGRARVDERSGCMLRSASDEGFQTTKGASTGEHVEKRRRVDGLPASEGVQERRTAPTRRRRPSPIHVAPAYHACLSSRTSSSTDLPSPHLGVFPTSRAHSPEAVDTFVPVPPPASPRLSPPSAEISQHPSSSAPPSTSLPTPFSPWLPLAQPHHRRRAKSLPASLSPAHLPAASLPSRTAQRSRLPASSRRTDSPSADDSIQQPRPPPLLQSPSSPKSFSQDELATLHALALSEKEGSLSTAGITTASLVPPITKDTLHELDLSEILRNPQLRHDVVFDPNLMFRPNYDGERCDHLPSCPPDSPVDTDSLASTGANESGLRLSSTGSRSIARSPSAADARPSATTPSFLVSARCSAHPFHPTSPLACRVVFFSSSSSSAPSSAPSCPARRRQTRLLRLPAPHSTARPRPQLPLPLRPQAPAISRPRYSTPFTSPNRSRMASPTSRRWLATSARRSRCTAHRCGTKSSTRWSR